MFEMMIDRFGSTSGGETRASAALPIGGFVLGLLSLAIVPGSAGADLSGDSTSPVGGPGFANETGESFQPPSDIEDGDGVGTLPSVWGGQDGVWFFGSADGTQVASFDEPTLLQRPAFALSGRLESVLGAVRSAHGQGYVIQELLPQGGVRFSFHGNVALGIDPAYLDQGLVQAELVVVDAFAPAQAAVQVHGQWSEPFALAGGSLGISPAVLRAASVRDSGAVGFGAIGTLGETYRLQLNKQNGLIQAVQGTF